MLRTAADRSERTSAASPVRSAFAVFAVVFGVWLALFVASAALLADLGALRDPAQPVSLHPTSRFCGTLALVLAYTTAAAYLGRRWTLQDVTALRDAVPMDDAEWKACTSPVLAREPRRFVLPALVGALAGMAVNVVGARLGSSAGPETWPGLIAWLWLLNPPLFGALGILVATSRDSARLFRVLGQRADVSLLDRRALVPFARSGFRLSALWLIGTSLAALLFLSSAAVPVVAAVLAFTLVVAVASLLGPSRGVRQRLRALKESELAWVRGEILGARAALADPQPAALAPAARLPALLAWEGRVVAASESPFDTSTLLRFALFALVPLASWIAAALMERAIDRLLQ